ncbi:hypothetical protein FA95DRAFT_1683320 [Auriscalpium vulgare]|uniref:Uncharacterized protein n=1 Tax=Auriscalpium vulgare TaxID=40419 RepID=A0ACB8RB72_9AGAM|nr:hypothetical protein FA95DRAFT_1683320 [Auriscalpium vulgare]
MPGLPLANTLYLNAPAAPAPHSYNPPFRAWSILPRVVITRILTFLDRGDSKLKTQLVRATHVCRSWRAAALYSPFLWADILIDSSASDGAPNRAAQLLARGAPLPIRLTLVGMHLHPGWLQMLLHSFHRFESIDIASCTIAEEDFRLFGIIIGSQAPLLTGFRLCLDQEISHNMIPMFRPALLTPRLNSFCLSGKNTLPLQWSTFPPWLNTLTHLSLVVETSDNSSVQLQDLDKVLDCLESIKGTLEILSLSRLRLRVPEGRSCRPVALPRLEAFQMEGDLQDIILLFACLDIGKSTILHLAPDITDGDNITDLFALLAGRQERIGCLRFLSYDTDHIGLEAHRYPPGRDRNYDLMDEPLLQVHVTGDIDIIPETSIQVMRSMCSILPDQALTVLDVPHISNRGEIWTADTWRYVLEGVQGIQEIRVEAMIADALCEALGWWHPSASAGHQWYHIHGLYEDREYFLPDLKRLILECVILPDSFPECLDARVEAGCPLRSLRVTLCCNEELDTWRETLRDVVDDLAIYEHHYSKELMDQAAQYSF